MKSSAHVKFSQYGKTVCPHPFWSAVVEAIFFLNSSGPVLNHRQGQLARIASRDFQEPLSIAAPAFAPTDDGPSRHPVAFGTRRRARGPFRSISSGAGHGRNLPNFTFPFWLFTPTLALCLFIILVLCVNGAKKPSQHGHPRPYHEAIKVRHATPPNT